MTTQQKGRIFISYRRDDSAGYAGRIYDRLAVHFGDDSVFMDVDTIEAGLDFVDVLENAVQSCDVLIALINKHWINIKNKEGKRRLDNLEDFVRIEIRTALKRNIRVIPVLFDDTTMPDSGQLPYELKPLARRNAVLIRHQSFHTDTNHLIKQLELGLKRELPPQSIPNTLSTKKHKTRRFFKKLASQSSATISKPKHLFIFSKKRVWSTLIFFSLAALLVFLVFFFKPYFIPDNLQVITPTNTSHVEKLAKRNNLWFSPIYSVSISNDGKSIATGSRDGALRIWDTHNGILRKNIIAHSDVIGSVAFSPNGALIATGSGDGTIKIWRSNDGELLETIEGYASYIRDIAFSPDGKKIASGSEDGIVRIWNATNGDLEQILLENPPSRFIWGVAFSPDGTSLAAGSVNQTIIIWRVSDGEILHILQSPGSAAFSVAFSPDGESIASGAAGNPISIWHTTNGELLNRFIPHSGSIWSIAFSPDGKLIVSGSMDKTARISAVNDGELLKTLSGHSSDVQDVAFSADGTIIVSGSRDGTMQIWGILPEN